ncbi:hypothetical protein HFO51_06585 [Rhizobium leguminosarum]|uniref:hypothetical protein n=1 Tax=Rhizobium leguminosarum TaxID=384 RepID=UPI001C98BFB3|nr:hypothetical protein [Rhizobium leguminosarum]MBY5594135.1 hypothetical protein [Rhizobium leguminosarum]
MDYEDPTDARIARDNKIRAKERAQQKPSAEERKASIAKGFAKVAFKDASGKGKHGPAKTTAAGYRAAASNPRRMR